MKTTSKLYQLASLPVALLIVATSLTLPAGAVGVTQAMDNGTKSSAACVRIATLQTTSESAITAKQSAMLADFSARLANITTREGQIDQKVATYRTNLVSTFDAKVAKLEAQKGVTVAQKAAIQTYKMNMLAAESTRENMVDTARQAYRSDLKSMVSRRQSNLTAAVTSFQAAVSGAFTTADSTCSSDSAAVTTLRTSVKAARTNLKTAYSDNKVASTIQQSATTRKGAVQTADQSFIQAAAGFSQTLSQALGSNK